MALNFPKNPMKGQVYDYAPFRYQWDGGRWLTSGRGAEPALEYVKAHEAATLIHSPDAIKWSEGIQQMITLTSQHTAAGNTAQIFHDGGASAAGTANVMRSMREHGSATWVWEKIRSGVIEYSTGTTAAGTNSIQLDVGTGGITTGGPTAFTHNGGYITNHGHGNIGRYHGNTYSFLTSPSDAHLCCNAYWNGANWLKMDNNQPSSYIVVKPNANASRATLYWSDAGSSNPQQHSSVLLMSEGTQIVNGAFLSKAPYEGFRLAPDDRNIASYVRSTCGNVDQWYLGKGSEGNDAASFYNYVFDTGVDLLQNEVNINKTLYISQGGGKVERSGVDVSGVRSGWGAGAGEVGLIRGYVEGGSYIDWRSRAAGIHIRCENPDSEAIGIWKITRPGIKHCASMDLHHPGDNAQVALNIEGGGIGGQQFVFYSSGVATAKTAWNVGSDRRFKINIQPLTYKRNTAVESLKGFSAKSYNLLTNLEEKRVGFIAQDVQEILPEAVTSMKVDSTDPNSEDRLYLDSTAIIALQHEAIKELVARVERLEALLGRTK